MQRLAFSSIGLALLTSALLYGCAGSPQPRDASSRTAMNARGMMDMNSMCDMHRRMMGSMSPAERQAMAEEHAKRMGMSMESMERHMQTMDQQCK